MADPGEKFDARREPPSAPRWVKVSVAVVVILVLLIAALALFGGGEHGPGRHASPADSGAAMPYNFRERHAPSRGRYR